MENSYLKKSARMTLQRPTEGVNLKRASEAWDVGLMVQGVGLSRSRYLKPQKTVAALVAANCPSILPTPADGLSDKDFMRAAWRFRGPALNPVFCIWNPQP